MELLILAMCCLVGCFAVLVFGAVFWVFVRRSRPYAPQEIAQAENAAEAHFAQTVPALLPWNVTAFADLACRWESSKDARLFRRNMGQVKSLSQPNQVVWLAFHLDMKGNRGFVRLRASDREVRLEIEQGNIRAMANELPLGSLRESDGMIFDNAAQTIGRYHRYRGLRWQLGSRSLSAHYGAVELHGRTIAEVNDNLIWSSAPFAADAAKRPLMRNLALDLTQDEENWLLALVALELYYDALRSRAYVAAGPPIR